MAAARKQIRKSADAFRSIGEAAGELDLQTHVLRYWESKFPDHVKPMKRADGRRFFRPQDMAALRAIQALVHRRGMTLKGARALIQEQGVDAVLNGEATLASPARGLQDKVREAFEAAGERQGGPARLRATLAELTDIKARLDAARGA